MINLKKIKQDESMHKINAALLYYHGASVRF